MITLYQAPLSAECRFIRLILSEYRIEFQLKDELPWERRKELLDLNHAGTVPILIHQDNTICSTYAICEYLDEDITTESNHANRKLLPQSPKERAEIRRIVDWFIHKFNEEVTFYVTNEKFIKHSTHQGSPDAKVLRAARQNLKHHLKYIGYLANERKWLGGQNLSYADLAAAAHLSCLDYMGEVSWETDEEAKNWYSRIKSRPSFRPLLNERIQGLPASKNYRNLDF